MKKKNVEAREIKPEGGGGGGGLIFDKKLGLGVFFFGGFWQKFGVFGFGVFFWGVFF